MIAPGVGYVFVLANAEGQSPVPPTVLTAMVAAAVWMKFLLDVRWSLPREVRFIGSSQIEILGYRVPWVRCQTRVSNRPPQGVLHFRNGGSCSSERRFVRILLPQGAGVKENRRVLGGVGACKLERGTRLQRACAWRADERCRLPLFHEPQPVVSIHVQICSRCSVHADVTLDKYLGKGQARYV